ncbi:MAG: hypothetical protein A2X64_03535 [Ignavibacteria bacterium GWF2_33_9]|nr:MAG: hypothetical protein A2X64_03535 [Ignavibacteria bacterium GWF2_33_9]
MLEKITHKLQTIFRVTRSELYVAVLIVIGVVAGSFASIYQNKHTKDIILDSRYFDSLAAYEKESDAERKEANLNYFANLNASKEVGAADSNDTDNITTTNSSNFNQPQNNRPRKLKAGGDNKQININTASKSELMQLPGIGDKTADKILEYRSQRKFNSASDIQKVKGIGPAKFAKMQSFIIVK